MQYQSENTTNILRAISKARQEFKTIEKSKENSFFKDKSGKYGRTLGDFVIFDGQEDRQRTLVEYMIQHYIGVAYEGQSKELIKEQQLKNISYLKAEGLID